MAKKITVAQDRENIRRIRKVIRTPAPVVLVAPVDPSVERERWLLRHPGLIPV